MIKTAAELGGETATGEKVRFVVGEAEACDGIEGVEEESVDVITSAMAVCASEVSFIVSQRYFELSKIFIVT